MTFTTTAPRGRAALVALLVVLVGCGPARVARPTSAPAAVPDQGARTAPGGCAGTVVTVGGAPPSWALAGFSGGGVGELPWAVGSPPDALAYVFAKQLVAAGRRPDGSANKILWVTRELSRDVTIEGRPLGSARPVVPIDGQIVYGNQLPTIVDVPTTGCWSFLVSWNGGGRHTSSINLNVLPAGTLPTRPSAAGQSRR